MNEQIAGQENFSLPHDIVLLPSEGKFYKASNDERCGKSVRCIKD